MPYFDKLGEDDKRGHLSYNEASSIDNKPVTEDMLRLKVKQIVQDEFFHQLEPVEVLEVRENPKNANKGLVVGRYVYSEYNKPFEQCVRPENFFIPLNPNLMQLPLPGEVVIGFEFAGQRYYFSSVNNSPDIINYDRTGISIDTEQSVAGQIVGGSKYFKDVSRNIKGRDKIYQGDTLIQGRHNNFIQLSSNQHKDSELNPEDVASGNINIGINNLTNKSSIRLTTAEQIDYPPRVIEIGNQMELSNNNRYKMKDRSPFVSKFAGPSIFMQSDRVVMYAKEDDIAIFAGKGNVHIKGTKVQIRNSEQVNISSKSFSQQVQTTYRLKEDLKSGNVLLLPNGIVERGRTLAEKHQENILHFFDQLNSLIPAAIPGTRSVPNPAWLKTIRDKIKSARKRLKQNKLIISLKWLDFDDWKTYTIDELREAWSPVPGMSEVLSKLSNLTDLIEEVDKLKEDYEVAKAQFEEYKAIAENPAEYFETLIYSKIESLTIDDFIQMEATLNDFEANGGDLSSIANGPELKQEAGQLKSQYEAIAQLPFEQQEDARKAWRDDARKFKEKCQGGFANGFSISIAEKEIDVSTKETAAVAGEALSNTMQASGEAQKNL